MEDQNGNTQVQTPPAASPASTGETVEQYKARIAELEKANEGRLRDLQAERAKRQELEAKLNSSASPAASEQGVTQDEVGKVLNPYLKAATAPLEAKVKEAEAFIQNSYLERTAEFLAEKTGKPKHNVLNDKDLTDKLVDVAKRYKLVGGVYDVTKRAYEIMELENLRASESERKRQSQANASQPLPGSTHVPNPVGSKEFSEADFIAMPREMYEPLANSGSFVMDEKSGKITWTPKS